VACEDVENKVGHVRFGSMGMLFYI